MDKKQFRKQQKLNQELQKIIEWLRRKK